MSKNAVCNSACLIALDRIGRMDLLAQSFEKVTIPSAVEKELGQKLDWVAVESVQNKAVIRSLKTQIADGESEAIALAMELGDVLVVLDDKKARRVAKQLGLKIIGTIGIILGAKKRGLIAEIKPILDSLQEANFRISPTLYQQALRLAKET